MSDRLRPHPEERLAAPVQLVDLTTTVAGLRTEPHAPVGGHRQIAVYRHGPVTLLLFVFEPEAVLREHRVDGVVTIHCLAGHLRVVAEEEAHDLTPGRLIAIAPNVPHTVLALTGSEMLLTVHRGTE